MTNYYCPISTYSWMQVCSVVWYAIMVKMLGMAKMPDKTLQMGRMHHNLFDVTTALLGDIQCPLDIATLDKAAALPIATSTPVTDLRHYINSNLVYNDLKI